MPVIVRLPAALGVKVGAAEVTLDEPVHDMGSVWSAIARQFPALMPALNDPIYNVAVNDMMLLHGVAQHPIKDGDIIEIVPTIAGG